MLHFPTIAHIHIEQSNVVTFITSINFCMLHLISSIQTPSYLANCCASNNIQYVPPEAEKHSSPYIFLWHTTYCKEFHGAHPAQVYKLRLTFAQLRIACLSEAPQKFHFCGLHNMNRLLHVRSCLQSSTT